MFGKSKAGTFTFLLPRGLKMMWRGRLLAQLEVLDDMNNERMGNFSFPFDEINRVIDFKIRSVL